MNATDFKALKERIHVISANEKKNMQCMELLKKDEDCFGVKYDDESCKECAIAAELDGTKAKLNELCKKVFEDRKGEKKTDKKKPTAEAVEESSLQTPTDEKEAIEESKDTDTMEDKTMGLDYGQFFAKLMQKVNAIEPNFTKSKPGTKSWWKFGIGKKGLALCAAFVRGKKFKVELYVDYGNDAENEKFLAQLEAKKADICTEICPDLTFENIKGKRACRVFCTNSTEIGEDKLLDWASPLLLKFKKTFTQIQL